MNLNELKKSTLLSYIPKAEGDKRFSRFASQSPNDISSDEKRKWAERASKRSKGIALAGEKLVAEESEQLDELHKKTIQSLIKKRGEQAKIAAAHSQTAKKAYLGNSRETGWRDPIVPRVVGQIGKIGQHDPAFLQTAVIFDRREKQAKDSIRKATLRLSGKKTKETTDMQNEEYTQVLEQMILSLTGMELEELHEAVGGRLSEDYQTPDREQETAGEMRRAQGNARRKAKAWRPGTSSRAYKQEGEFDHAVDKLTSKVSQVEKERRSRNVFGLGGKKVAKPGARTMSKISGQRGAQLAADQDDRAGKYMGDAEFSRSSDKATNLIAAAKKARTRL